MTCPKCGARTRVIRTSQDVGKVLRERRCLAAKCSYQFTTAEVKATKEWVDELGRRIPS